MKALAFTIAAAGDLEEVWDYTECEWGLTQPRRYAEELRDTATRWLRAKGAAGKLTFGPAI